MSFLIRAKSMHERGDAVRAAIILAEGLKRDPSDGEALEWLLHLYVEELPNPGIERELLNILAQQHNGADLYEIVEAELDELGRAEKIEALRRTAHREGITFEAQPDEPELAAFEDAPPEAVAHQAELPITTDDRPPRERWDEFDSPLAQAPESGRVARSSQALPVEAPSGSQQGAGRAQAYDDMPLDAETRAHFARRKKATMLAALGVLVVAVIAILTLGGRNADAPVAEGSAASAASWTSATGEGSGP